MTGSMVSFPTNGSTTGGYIATPRSDAGPGVLVHDHALRVSKVYLCCYIADADANCLQSPAGVFHGKPDEAWQPVFARTRADA